MKKLLFALAFAGLTSSAAMAQETEIPTEKYSVATNRFWSNWFIQGSGFYGTYSRGGQAWNLFKKDNSNFGFGVALGKWFTPALGIRAKFQGLKIKEAGETSDGYLARFDIMGNLCNLFGGYKQRVVDVNIFTGWGKMTGHGELWDMGLNLNFNVAKRLGIFVEGTLINTDNHGHWFNFYRGWNHRYVTGELGLTVNLGKVGWNKVPDVDAIMALNKSQLDALNAQLADAEAENAKLKAMLAQKPKASDPVVKTVKELQTVPASVFFNLNSATISSKKDLVNVQELVNLAKSNGGNVIVTGYADSKTGSSNYNQTLSEKRAKAVADKLVEMGVSRDKIQIVAKGGVDNLNPYAYNRRVTVEVK